MHSNSVHGWYASSVQFDRRPDGSVELGTGPVQLHCTGRILIWDSACVLAYQAQTAPRPEIPNSENKLVIRWAPVASGDRTILALSHRRLTRPTALGFMPGTHMLLDRLAVCLDKTPLPPLAVQPANGADSLGRKDFGI